MIVFLFAAMGFLSYTILFPIPHVETEFDSYVQQFIQDAASRGVYLDYPKNANISFADLKGNTIGTCWHIPRFSEQFAIEISKSYWESASIENKTSVIYHELGHCMLNKSHVEKYIQLNGKQCPSSIMHPTNELAYCLFENYNYYLDELFLNK